MYTIHTYHFPSAVHRFGANSDWTVGEAERTGRIEAQGVRGASGCLPRQAKTCAEHLNVLGLPIPLASRNHPPTHSFLSGVFQAQDPELRQHSGIGGTIVPLPDLYLVLESGKA